MTSIFRKRLGVALVAMLAAGTTAVGLTALAQEEPSCPAAPAGSIVVTLPFEELYSNRGPGPSVGSSVAVNIPAGVYDVRGTTWDDHVINGDVKDTQRREVLAVEGLSGGSVVFQSGETPDLPDNQNSITAFVDSAVTVPDLTALRAVHGDPGADATANSLHPVCFVFVPVTNDTTTTTVPDDTTTTTVPDDTTTTTVPDDTTTTTVPGDTTTTTVVSPTSTSTTTPDATTTTVVVAPTSTTPDPTSTTPDTLPFTGVESDQLAVVAALAVAAGAGIVGLTRTSAESASKN